MTATPLVTEHLVKSELRQIREIFDKKRGKPYANEHGGQPKDLLSKWFNAFNETPAMRGDNPNDGIGKCNPKSNLLFMAYGMIVAIGTSRETAERTFNLAMKVAAEPQGKQAYSPDKDAIQAALDKSLKAFGLPQQGLDIEPKQLTQGSATQKPKPRHHIPITGPKPDGGWAA